MLKGDTGGRERERKHSSNIEYTQSQSHNNKKYNALYGTGWSGEENMPFIMMVKKKKKKKNKEKGGKKMKEKEEEKSRAIECRG
jgi:2-oxo-4-hydroxy-4-carboxy--5-ureidoimidazoline (OHCU) decarboxylase